MRCLKCDYPTFNPLEACPNCQFQGDPTLIEELGHIKWLLNEMRLWQTIEAKSIERRQLHKKYMARQRELEITLGLRLPPFSKEQARKAWPELIQREVLLQKMERWQQAGDFKPGSTDHMVNEARRQAAELREQLEGHLRPPYPRNDAERLDLANFLLEAVEYLSQNGCFAASENEVKVRSSLQSQIEALEINLGLRPPKTTAEKKPTPQPSTQPQSEVAGQAAKMPVSQSAAATASAAPATQPAIAMQPPLSFSERFLRTLLSERTLQALLFLAIFLIFAAAISGAFWGWKDFSAPVRVLIPTAFTLLFFGMGWYVRAKTPQYRLGIALSATAALLIPIDFYTVYVNFNTFADYRPQFWLVTSLFCLLAYTGAALVIRSRLFGYLVGLAAGSTVLALIEIGHQSFGLSTDWRSAGLSILALVLLLVAIQLGRYGNKFVYFIDSFRYLSLLTISITMLVTFGWRFTARTTYDTLHDALIVNWWVGTFIFAWGAVFYRSRGLGTLAAITLPVAAYLAQAAVFDQADINTAWHAFGFALLVPVYFGAGYKLLTHRDDAILHGHGRTAIRIGILLIVLSINWSLFSGDGWAAAWTHTLLAASIALAALLWRRPFYLYPASLLSFSAVTFAMMAGERTWSHLSVAWASLAIIHIILALQMGSRFPVPMPNYARPLVMAGFAIAAMAMLPPLFPYDGRILGYAMGNWIALSAWGARLTHVNQPGFASKTYAGKSVFHWFTSLSLPIWLWVLFFNARPPDFSLPLALAVLAWAMVLFSYQLERVAKGYRQPWWVTGILVSIAAPVVAFMIVSNGLTLAITLLSAGLLYFADAVIRRQSGELVPAGLVTAWGYLLLLSWLNISAGALSFGLTVLVAVYFLAGLGVERKKSDIFTHRFLSPLYLTGHFLSLTIVGSISVHPLNEVIFGLAWTDEMRLWGAAAQFLLGVVYGLYAWGSYKERWGHIAAWLIAGGGGFIAITFSTGRGSSAAKAALIAIVFVLAERGLHWLWRQQALKRRQQAFFRLTWHLYKRPLLVTGWAISGIVIALALVRNLVLLGGGSTQQLWAAIGLLLVTGLYALSARLFRQAHFVWLASILVFAPWTILTNLGWLTPFRPTVAGFALSWMVLAWALLLIGLSLSRFAGQAYVLPLTTMAHLWVPFSLLWGIGDVNTSRFTFGLAVGFYALLAILDHREFSRGQETSSALALTKFLYPALGLAPIWCGYLMAWLLPVAQRESYGLMILVFGAVGLATGQWLGHIAPRPAATRYYALPAYLTGYGSMFVGTTLVANDASLLALALLYDALLMVISALLFKHSVWVYLAAAIFPLSLLSALSTTTIPWTRYGWWLIGLSSIYLFVAWVLRWFRLSAYGTAMLNVGFVIIALGLLPSSMDQTGALWGYGSAALLYTIAAFWLRQPLLLTPASILAIVPYVILLQRSSLSSEYYGLALLPGAIVALGFGWGLDQKFGRWTDFPWGKPAGWPMALLSRWLGWWGLPLFVFGFGLSLASPFFSDGASRLALNFLILVPIFGWAVYYFRLRIWLFALAVAGQLAVVFFFASQGWWRDPDLGWARFLPVTLITTLVALFIERQRKEDSPLRAERMFAGWSRPLYLIALFDIMLGQLISLNESWPAVIITLAHTILIAGLASIWLSSTLCYISLIFGTIAAIEWFAISGGQIEELTVTLAGLALVYGMLGYGLFFVRNALKSEHGLSTWLGEWELPLQRFSIGLSLAILCLTVWLGMDVLGWTIGTMLDLPFRGLMDLAKVWLVIGVLALVGLLYLIVALAHHWLRLSYVAIGMLVASWMLFAIHIQQWSNLQWFVIPMGLYLLGISYFEWQRGNKVLGRWLDYAALSLMIFSLFWQTLLFGWGYALLLGIEGFLAIWWGSARRLRRFLYAGVIGVILAVIGPIINSLWSVSLWILWIVFGVVGLLLFIIVSIGERKLEELRAWREVLETWE